MILVSTDRDVMTLVNVFTVDPSRCDELVHVLIDATRETIRHRDGFVSANIHRSQDGRRVVNYAQWASVEAFEAMRSRPEVSPHMVRASELAESFDPIICSVVDTTPKSSVVRHDRTARSADQGDCIVAHSSEARWSKWSSPRA